MYLVSIILLLYYIGPKKKIVSIFSPPPPPPNCSNPPPPLLVFGEISKNNILGLIPDIKAYFRCTNVCRNKDLQISWINAGSEKFMTSEIFRSFYL